MINDNNYLTIPMFAKIHGYKLRSVRAVYYGQNKGMRGESKEIKDKLLNYGFRLKNK